MLQTRPLREPHASSIIHPPSFMLKNSHFLSVGLLKLTSPSIQNGGCRFVIKLKLLLLVKAEMALHKYGQFVK